CAAPRMLARLPACSASKLADRLVLKAVGTSLCRCPRLVPLLALHPSVLRFCLIRSIIRDGGCLRMASGQNRLVNGWHPAGNTKSPPAAKTRDKRVVAGGSPSMYGPGLLEAGVTVCGTV